MDTETKSMKIIIFGAAGAIGNFLSKKYLKKIINFYYLSKIKNQKKKLIKLLNLKKK